MAIDISINNTVILSGERLVPGWPIIPYRYLENGNFAFITNNGDYPDYTQFGVTQFLIYASQAEIGVIRGSST